MGKIESEGGSRSFIVLSFEFGHPRLIIWSPANIKLIDEKHSSTGHSSWGSELEMRYFEDESHGRCEGNTLLRHKRKHLVVIHDSVTGFNPHWVNITIKNDPLELVFLFKFIQVLAHITHHH